MRLFFPKQDGIVIPRATKKGIKREVEKLLIQQLGRHVSTLQEIAVRNPINPKLNGYAVYTEAKEQYDPQEIFEKIIKWGTNYFFGMVTMQRSHKTFYFLADIQIPLSVGTERILLQGVKKIQVYVKP